MISDRIIENILETVDLAFVREHDVDNAECA